MPVSQISFVRLTTPAEKPYGSDGSKYQGQEGPQASRYYLNYRALPLGRPHGRRRSGK
jgi:dCTP deaminase